MVCYRGVKLRIICCLGDLFGLISKIIKWISWLG